MSASILESAWQASESLEFAAGIDDIATDKVVSLEAEYTNPGKTLVVSAKASDALRPTRTFDLEVTYKIKAWLSSSLSLTDLTNPTLDVGTKFQLNHNTSLELGADNIFGRQSYRTQLEFSF